MKEKDTPQTPMLKQYFEIKAQYPEAGKLIPQNGVIVLYTKSEKATETVEVPNLTGLTVSQARSTAKAAGLNVEIVGTSNDFTGASYTQSISKGTKVALGSTVTVAYMTSTQEMEIEDTGNAD